MPVDSPFQYNSDRLPDCRFEPGCLAHVVVGNEGRALDYRRTPVRIREVRYSSGLMILEILDFEDKGNTWEIPFEDVRRFQFASGATRAGLGERSRLETVVHTLNRPLEIACDRDVRGATLCAVEDAEREAAQWVERRSVARRSGRIDFSANAGVDALFTETASYMEHYNVAANEARLRRTMPASSTTAKTSRRTGS